MEGGSQTECFSRNKWFWRSVASAAAVLFTFAISMFLLAKSGKLVAFMIWACACLSLFFVNGLPTPGVSLEGLQRAALKQSSDVAPAVDSLEPRSRLPSPTRSQHAAKHPTEGKHNGRIAPLLIHEDFNAYASFHGDSSGPVAMALFAEKQLRWSFVLPVFLMVCIGAMITTLLSDSGTLFSGDSLIVWTGGRPILP